MGVGPVVEVAAQSGEGVVHCRQQGGARKPAAVGSRGHRNAVQRAGRQLARCDSQGDRRARLGRIVRPRHRPRPSARSFGSPTGFSVMLGGPSTPWNTRRGQCRLGTNPTAISRSASRSGSGGVSDTHSMTGPSAGPGAIGAVHWIRNGSEASYGPEPTSHIRQADDVAVGGRARALRHGTSGRTPPPPAPPGTRRRRRPRRPTRSVRGPSAPGPARGSTRHGRPRSARRTPVAARGRARSRCRRGALPRARRAGRRRAIAPPPRRGRRRRRRGGRSARSGLSPRRGSR